jgi:hypothetical protein
VPVMMMMMMELLGCPETSVEYYHYLLRYNPEERSSNKSN